MNNPNQKGVIGQVAVKLDLLKKGYFVYEEVTKHSKIDLIAVTQDYTRLLKIQVKSISSNGNKLQVPVRKMCLDAKYNSLYEKGQNDFYAIYVRDLDIVFYIPEDLWLEYKNNITFYTDNTVPEKNVEFFMGL